MAGVFMPWGIVPGCVCACNACQVVTYQEQRLIALWGRCTTPDGAVQPGHALGPCSCAPVSCGPVSAMYLPCTCQSWKFPGRLPNVPGGRSWVHAGVRGIVPVDFQPSGVFGQGPGLMRLQGSQPGAGSKR